MDVVLLSILLLTAIINSIMAILMIKHYIRTRYAPSLVLALFFISKGMLDWVFCPSLGSTKQQGLSSSRLKELRS